MNWSAYTAALKAATDDVLADELRHVSSALAREARGTRERDYWAERRRYVWGEWKRRCVDGSGHVYARGRGYVLAAGGWHEVELQGWDVGLNGLLHPSNLEWEAAPA